MDARAEYEVFKCFRQMCQDRKVLLISHRFSTVSLADYIVVIENGRILESGTHRALIQRRSEPFTVMCNAGEFLAMTDINPPSSQGDMAA